MRSNFYRILTWYFKWSINSPKPILKESTYFILSHGDHIRKFYQKYSTYLKTNFSHFAFWQIPSSRILLCSSSYLSFLLIQLNINTHIFHILPLFSTHFLRSLLLDSLSLSFFFRTQYTHTISSSHTLGSLISLQENSPKLH